jgi:hypothetical protein
MKEFSTTKLYRLPPILLEIVKGEARIWISAGAKHLSFVTLGE